MNTYTIILSGILWGGIAIFVSELSGRGLSSLQIVAVRVTLCAIILATYALIAHRNAFKIKIRDLGFFLGTGVLSIFLFNFLYFEAINVMESVAIPALLLYTSPVFVMILSAIFFKERITPKKIICLAITLVGLVFITGALTSDAGVGIYPLMLGLGSGLCYALYSIFSKPLLSRYSPLTVTLYTFIIASFIALPTSQLWNMTHVFADISTILYSLGIAVVCTVAPFTLYTCGLKKVEASRAAILVTIEPIIAALIGFFMMGEEVTASKIVGMVLIFASILIINTKSSNKISQPQS